MTSVLFAFCHFARERGDRGEHVGRSMSSMCAYMLLAAFLSIQENHLEPLLDTIYVILPGQNAAVFPANPRSHNPSTASPPQLLKP
jgi:hypothetical protein